MPTYEFRTPDGSIIERIFKISEVPDSVELPDGSDTLRYMLPVMGEHPLFWKVTNRGKRGITLDVRKPEG